MSLRNSTVERRDDKTLVCDKRDNAIACVLCRDLHITLMFSGVLLKDRFKGGLSLMESFFPKN